MQKNSLLIVNDVTGYGRVSTFAMLPILAQYGIHAYVLPTALVSNTMDYGSAEILDTTEFMKSTIASWNKYGFKFSNICIGLINSSKQVETICSLIDSQDNPFVIVDPIMADEGKLYPNMYPGAVGCNRFLASKADVIIPNVTEATMLIDKYVGRTSFDDDEYEEIARDLANLGPKNIVITGCSNENDEHFNLVYDATTSVLDKVEYEYLPVQFIGTGDVFSACLVAQLIAGASLKESVTAASKAVTTIVKNNLDNKDNFDLIIETSLSEI